MELYNLNNNLQTIKEVSAKIALDDTLRQFFLQKNAEFVHISEYCSTVSEYLCANFDMEQCAIIDYCRNFESNFVNRGINSNLDINTQIEMESKDKLHACQKYLNGIALRQ